MGKSYKKTPITGNVYGSDKAAKREANKKLRRLNRVRLMFDREPLSIREVSDVFNFPKDGKAYVNELVRK